MTNEQLNTALGLNPKDYDVIAVGTPAWWYMMAPAGVTFLYGLIYWLFDNYIWKWKLLRKVLNVPDLNGHWEGNLISATYQTTIHMDLDDDNHLFGRYFNNRDNSNVGNRGGNIGTFESQKTN